MTNATSSGDNDDAIIGGDWYYSIEVKNGVFTNGREHINLAPTRKLLRTVAFENQDCLDVGTQEAVIPILLRKGGAKRMVAYDRFDLSAKIALLQKVYGTPFDYVSGIQLSELPARLDAQGGRFFDLVVFSGVLYHMINPLGLLATVRGFCKSGGLFLIETAAIQHADCHLVFNAKGQKYGPASNYFIPTTAWLDYVLRMLALRPLDVSHVGGDDAASISRVAILCRSEDKPRPLDPGDQWLAAPFHEKTFRNESQVDWNGMRQAKSRIEVKGAVGPIRGSLFEAIRDTPPHRIAPDELRLTLRSDM